jgi:hypothetical protein
MNKNGNEHWCKPHTLSPYQGGRGGARWTGRSCIALVDEVLLCIAMWPAGAKKVSSGSGKRAVGAL